MNRGPSFEHYLGIVRKHWLLILLVGAAVLASGAFYHSRQVPAFSATTKLKIIRQKANRNAADLPFTFEEDQVFYNTQYNLLTTQLDWAGQVLDRAAALLLVHLGGWPEGPDPAARAIAAAADLRGEALADALAGDAPESDDAEFVAAVARVREEVIGKRWGITPDSFLGGVQAQPIPNTYLAELSFTADDPGIAVAFANLYAELYRDVSTEERVETVGKQRKQLEDRRDARQELLTASEARLTGLRAEHPELAFGPSMNLPQQEADAIATRINTLEVEAILERSDLDRIGEALDSHGISVREDSDSPSRLVAGDGVDLIGTLSRAADILGLRVVETSDGVAQARGRIRALEEEISRLRRELTEQAQEVKTARAALADETIELGREVAGAITRAFQAARDRDAAIAILRARLDEKRQQARVLNELYSEYVETSDRVVAGRREIESLRAEIAALAALEESSKAGAGTGPVAIQSIGIERRARLVDARQIRPNTMMILLLSGLAAVFLSLGAAFLVEFFDDTIKTKDDFVRLVGVPDIGFIPRISEKEVANRDLAAVEMPRSGVAEAFRSVRTGILFSKKDAEIRSLLVTSAGPGEGKTTVAVNLALVMAEAGRGKILLIDADLRKPRVHTALGVENTTGLTNCLVGSATLSETARETQVPNLFVLPAGPTPPNPAELLGGHRMTEVMEEALRTYGMVILDTPPLVAVTDTCLLAPRVEGVFLVISVGRTSWRLIARGKEALAAVGEEATGAILNNVRARQSGYGYGYGLEGGYGEKSGR